mmetsp:Transcript_2286/g.2815  ORF Transcript_2286/g.2815 Transcript_2286/m.2815 type:complete len:216 (+) Transcript_2286:680-1327(+)
MATIAKRPLLISASRDRLLASGSAFLGKGKPNFPKPGASPGIRSASCLIGKSSKKPMKTAICAHPSAGNLYKAWMPLGMSANFRSVDGEQYPGHRKYSGTMYPMQAHMATRPFLISAIRRRRKVSASPSLDKPRGSKYFKGIVTPASFSKALQAVVLRLRTAPAAATRQRAAAPLADRPLLPLLLLLPWLARRWLVRSACAVLGAAPGTKASLQR